MTRRDEKKKVLLGKKSNNGRGFTRTATFARSANPADFFCQKRRNEETISIIIASAGCLHLGYYRVDAIRKREEYQRPVIGRRIYPIAYRVNKEGSMRRILSEVLWYDKIVGEEEVWNDPRLPDWCDCVSISAEATERTKDTANAWLVYRRSTPEEEEWDDYLEHHGRRDRAYHRAGF